MFNRRKKKNKEINKQFEADSKAIREALGKNNEPEQSSLQSTSFRGRKLKLPKDTAERLDACTELIQMATQAGNIGNFTLCMEYLLKARMTSFELMTDIKENGNDELTIRVIEHGIGEIDGAIRRVGAIQDELE